MATFSYYGITFDLSTITRQLEVVYDGPTFLYEQWTIHVTGRLNPDAMSYRGATKAVNVPGGGVVVVPSPQGVRNELGCSTDAAIRHLLSQPQGPLKIQFADDESPTGVFTWIESPSRASYKTDANNGPRPLHVNVTKITGSVDMEVEWIGVVCLNESPIASVVLSHRWRAVDDIADAQGGFLTRRSYFGKLIVRTDALRQLPNNVTPDAFRRYLFMPVMANCQRGPVHVELNEDGNELVYHFTDSERMYNLTSAVQRTCPGLVDLEAHHNSSIGKTNLDEILVAAGGVLERGARRGIAAAAATGVWVIPGIGAAAVAMGATAFDAGVTAINLVPKNIHTVTATAYGDRDADHKNLEIVATAFIMSRMNAVNMPANFGAPGLPGGAAAGAAIGIAAAVANALNPTFVAQGTGHINIGYGFRRDMMVVDVTMCVKQGIFGVGGITGFGPAGLVSAGVRLATALGRAAATLTQAAAGNTGFPTNIMPAVPRDGAQIQRTAAVNPAPQNSGGSRGTLLEGLVVQALQSQCGLPPGPVLYGPARDLTVR